MDASPAYSSALAYSSAAPVLIAGSGASAISRAERTVAASGARFASVSLAEAPRRIDAQARAAALWIEMDESTIADPLFDALAARIAEGRFPAIVAAPSMLIDSLAAVLPNEVQLVIDASDTERASALAVALSGADRADRLSDVASDQNTARLRQLSDEVGRIAATLARLSADPATTSPQVPKVAPAEAPPVSVELLRSIIRARRLRGRFFSDELFADPAWDMLLDLLQAEIAQLRVPVSSLCIAAAVPATTALRWLKGMTEQGLFVRRADPHDARRVFVELAPTTSAALRHYFAEVGKVAVV